MMNRLELKIPPPLVALCIGLLMWLLSRVVPSFEVPLSYRISASLALVAVGLLCDLTCLIAFMRARTTPNPWKPDSTSTLVSTGFYRYSRNPMYLGQLLLLLGWAVFLSNVAAVLLAPLFVLYINRFQIAPEERVLAALFGEAFTAYKMRVRRWL